MSFKGIPRRFGKGTIDTATKGDYNGEKVYIAVDSTGKMISVMKGDDSGTLRTVAVDADGQMYVAITGQSIGVNNHPSDYFKSGENIGNVNNVPSDYFKDGESAAVKGDDSGTKRYIAVDNAGIMLARMKGASGAVLKDIAVDSNGLMLARMKGDFGGTLKDIAVDTTGIMKAHMSGKHNYGAAGCGRNETINLPASTTTQLYSTNGEGYFYYAMFKVAAKATCEDVYPLVEVDGNNVEYYDTFKILNMCGFDKNTRPLQLIKYGAGSLCVAAYLFDPPIYFDTTLKLKMHNTSGASNHTGYVYYIVTKT